MYTLYIHPGKSSFVRKDICILESNGKFREHHFLLSKTKLPISFLKELWFLMKYGIQANNCVIQFAGYHSFLPVLLSKLFRYKVVIILGGTDTVSFPSIKYGAFYNKKLRWFTQWSIRNAHLLLPVSETLVETNYDYQPNDYPKQGYRFFITKKTPPFEVVYNGYDPDKWYISLKEPNSFVTAAFDLSTRFGVQLKGIDLILEIAPHFPECKFYIVGGHTLQSEVPENVIKLGVLEQSELAQVLSTKSYYLQLSMSEGFPNSLCEAMLSGCIPIVSKVGAMPLIVQDLGHILLQKDANQLISLISEIVNRPTDENLPEMCRLRISDNFTLEKRAKLLVKAIGKS